MTIPMKLAAVLLAASPVSAFAATGREALAPSSVEQITVARSGAASNAAAASRIVSTVHNEDGVRYDVPAELLARPGVLINGLGPQPQQFD